MDTLIIGDKTFTSRLFLGTGKFSSNQVMEQAILASGTEMVTAALKRVDVENEADDMLKHFFMNILRFSEYFRST
jgi:thiazole synthase